ncbi:MAG: glycosyltransferase [Chloroflexi bacterium]|nr:glycosyltransferase [Chloroflexota bacterium]
MSVERRPYASILLPTKNPGPGITSVLEAIFRQEAPVTFEVVIVDSGSCQADLERMRRFPVQLAQIPPAEFGHGRTRNLLGRRARGDVLVYLSQDAQPASPSWLATLVRPLGEPGVAGAYARQLPRPDADPMARFFLQEMYGCQPARRQAAPGQRLRLADMFFSNASSAVRRDVWQRFPFREDVVMSEDQYWAHDVLRAGYCVVYEPAAQVLHSHNYSLRSLFRRNRLSGASLRGLIADSAGAVAARGLRYVAREAAFLVRAGQPAWLAFLLPYEAAKALGFALGAARGVPVGAVRNA